MASIDPQPDVSLAGEYQAELWGILDHRLHSLVRAVASAVGTSPHRNHAISAIVQTIGEDVDALHAHIRAALVLDDQTGLQGWSAALGQQLVERGQSARTLLELLRLARSVTVPVVVGEAQGEPTRLLRLLQALETLLGWVTDPVLHHFERDRSQLEQDALFIENLVENLPAMIFVKQARDLRFVRVNRAGEALLGFSRDELLGKTDYDFFPPEEADFFTAKDRDVLEAGTLADIPCEPIQTARGETRYLHTKKIPLLDETGQARFLLGISQDITEALRVQTELERAKADAEAASQAKSEFLARMSHEIRTPMNGIIGLTEVVLGTELAPSQREMLGLVKSSADSLLRIINDVLDFSKIEAGRLELESMVFDLTELIDSTVGSFAHRARDKGLTLELERAEDTPSEVAGDALRLRQVLVNLIDNALRFTQAGGVRVRLGPDPDGASPFLLRCVIEDTGMGIPKDKQEAIFDAFTQADGSTTRRFGGTGLGLAISNRLVKAMGGRLWLESEVGVGSRFSVVVPLARPDTRLSSESLPTSPGLQTVRDPIRVLLAEDNPVNQRVAVHLLERVRCRVDVVETGRQAVDALQGGAYDIVLMDLEMPEMGGLEAIGRIREAEDRGLRRLPILAVTAHATPEDRERCLAAGADGYITKPFRGADLEAAIAAALARVRLPKRTQRRRSAD